MESLMVLMVIFSGTTNIKDRNDILIRGDKIVQILWS